MCAKELQGPGKGPVGSIVTTGHHAVAVTTVSLERADCILVVMDCLTYPLEMPKF